MVVKDHEFFERLAVMVKLRGLRGRGIGDAVGARKQAVQIVKTVVLCIDDHHMIDLLDGGRRCQSATQPDRRKSGAQAAEFANTHPSLALRHL